MENSKKILLVDDDRTFVTLISGLLRDRGYSITSAGTGQEALALIQEDKPDLVILDVLMPKLTGYDFMQKLKNMNDELRKVPLLVISANKDMQEYFPAWQIEGFIAKPFEPKRFLTKVEEIIHLKTIQQEREKEISENHDPFSYYRGKRVLIVTASEFLQGRLREHMESKGILVETAADQEEGVSRAVIFKPHFIFHGDQDASSEATTIREAWQAIPCCRKTPVILMCKQGDWATATKPFVTYLESADLIYKIGDYFEKLYKGDAEAA